MAIIYFGKNQFSNFCHLSNIIHIYIFTFHMTLIKNISGFRGTIGGKNLENLTPNES